MGKSLTRVLTVVTVFTFIFSSILTVSAQEIEEWDKPVYVHGAQLTEQEVKTLAEEMGYTELSNLDVMNVTAQDKIDLMGEGNPDSNMYSSAIIEKKEEGHGIDVKINREDHITKITSDQYVNALITAGVTDVLVVIDSPKPVTGESALAGIYKVYHEKGMDLEKDRMAIAQEELETTADIADSLGEDEKTALDDAIIEIKQQLAELKEGQLTEDKVEEIITKALEKRGMGSLLTDEQLDKLITLFFKYGNTSAVDSDLVKRQLGDLKDSVNSKLGDLKDWADDTGFFDKVGNFIRELWTAFKGIFTKE